GDEIALLDGEVHVAHRVDRGRPRPVDLVDVAQLDEDASLAHPAVSATPTISGVPGSRPWAWTWEKLTSVASVRTGTGRGPSGPSTQTAGPRGACGTLGGADGRDGIPGTKNRGPAPAIGGRNRSAAFGTRRTSLRSSTTMVTVAVIPGRNRPSGFSTASTVS